MRLSLIILLFFIGCQKNNEVILMKQWHLDSKTNTVNITKSKELPQFANQYSLYKKIESYLVEDKNTVVLAEGCSNKKINHHFKQQFNGWTVSLLKEKLADKNFEYILAPIPMKIAAKFPDVEVICSDSEKLIKENLLAFSELKGHINFYLKFKSSKGTKRYTQFIEAYRELYPKENINDYEGHALAKSLAFLNSFEEKLYQRNDYFIDKIKQYKKDKNVIVVIGGLHVEDLKSRLTFGEVYTPEGYVDQDRELIQSFKRVLEKENKLKTVYYQIPRYINLKLFKNSKKINLDQILSSAEKDEVMEIIKKANIDQDLLASDFDGDGIRDFTISKNGRTVVIAAEDNDWDNDGVNNLIDLSLGSANISNKTIKKISNTFNTQASESEILQKLKQEKINLLSKESDLLVLEVLVKLLALEEFKKTKLENIAFTEPTITYGKNVYFSYVTQSKTLEVYFNKLMKHVLERKKNIFKDNSLDQIVTGYLIPLLVHSISHELAHSLEIDETKIAKMHNWTFDEKQYEGKYLKEHRLAEKVIYKIKQNYRYKKLSFGEWMSLVENHKGKKPFILKKNIPSLYALKNPSEWFAEAKAMCIFRKVYPRSSDVKYVTDYIESLGINPTYNDLCP